MSDSSNGRLGELRQIAFLSLMAVILGFAGGVIAFLLYHMIGFLTNVLFYQHFSLTPATFAFANPFQAPIINTPWRFLLILIPAFGGLLVSIMARYGSKRISGHGEPETIEAILTNRSKIQPKIGILKPISAGITIGTGGPFGAEGPIIQTGGALGSVIGQFLNVTTTERKILLASGAGAGMAAILGTPIAAVLFVIELLLFEFSARSVIPVAIASGIGGILHFWWIEPRPLFAVTVPVNFGPVYGLGGLPLIALLGVLCGVVGSALTKLLYYLEDVFRKVPVNDFLIPVLGGALVGTIGFVDPSVLGTGYTLIQSVLNTEYTANLAVGAGLFLLALLVLKALAWTVALSTGSSGGTLAPLFMMGGAFGGMVGLLFQAAFPSLGLTASACAIVGMVAVFAASSRAALSSIVFGAEVTGIYTFGNFSALVPLAVGCVVADAVAIYLIGDETVMTGKLTRKGIRVSQDYRANLLEMVGVSEVMSTRPRTVPSTMPATELRSLLADLDRPEYHMRSFPVVDAAGKLVAVVTRTDLFRERDRLEIDVVLEHGADLTLVEAKAGRTPSRDHFAAFPAFAERIEARGDRRWRIGRRLVVYGGEESQARSAGDLVSWSELPEVGFA